MLPNFIYAEQNSARLLLVDKVIANVGTETILFSDLQTTLFQLHYREENIDEDQVAAQLVENSAIISKAKENFVSVDLKDVESKVQEHMNFLLDKFSNNKRLMESYLGKKFYALKKDFGESFKDHYLTEKLQRSLLEDVRCTHKDVVRFFKKLEKEEKIPVIKESFEAYELTLSPGEDPKILNTLLEIRKKIDEGEDFVKLVKEYSQDESTIEGGGEIGWCKIGELMDEYERAALALKPGEVSRIVKTARGYHLIQLIDIDKDEFNSRHIFLFSTFNDDMSPLIEKGKEIRNKILNHELSWNEAIKKFSADESKKSDFGLITRGYKNFFTQKNIPEEDFEIIKNLNEGEISEPFSCSIADKNIVKIIYLRKKNPIHSLNLRDDYEQISDMAKNYKNQMILLDKKKKVVDEVDLKIDKEIFKFYNS
ncbi:MAG: peptidylprolyl isomerase [Cytophagales bacterium]|nr:peptidylprolyl isomerase [Cytophagales bacterium]